MGERDKEGVTERNRERGRKCILLSGTGRKCAQVEECYATVTKTDLHPLPLHNLVSTVMRVHSCKYYHVRTDMHVPGVATTISTPDSLLNALLSDSTLVPPMIK